MAVTTSTLQFGAELPATISSGHWSIEGKIGGDALIVLPLTFDVSIYGGVHVKYRGHNLVGVDFKGGMSGPSPIVLRGEVCVSLLLFDALRVEEIRLPGNPRPRPGIGFPDHLRPPRCRLGRDVDAFAPH